MKSFVSAGSFLVLALLLVLSLAGCGGVSANPRPTPSPTPTPPGATPTPTPAAAHGTFVYVSNASSATSTAQLTGYRLNADGTLALLPNSPFTVNGFPSGTPAGNFLVTASGNMVFTYAVDPASGALTLAGSAAVVGAGGIVTDSKNIYVSGNIPASNSTGIYGFAVSANGMLTSLAGSPYVFTQACDLCDVPFALALNNNFLIQGGVGFHGVGDFTVYPRGAGGVLGKAQILGTDAEESVTIQRPTGAISYALNTDDFSLTEFTIGPSGTAAIGAQTFIDTQPEDILIDNTGRFLLVLDLTGVVHVFSINPGNGNFSQIGTSEAAGNGAGGIVMDPSGHFVFMTQGANPNFPGSVNQITVYTFDPATGAMKKLQIYPQPGSSGITVIAR
ncbi:MAG TPA: beta-propeller fold lactonase family protein [Candidatus Angelobacter sp.]